MGGAPAPADRAAGERAVAGEREASAGRPTAEWSPGRKSPRRSGWEWVRAPRRALARRIGALPPHAPSTRAGVRGGARGMNVVGQGAGPRGRALDAGDGGGGQPVVVACRLRTRTPRPIRGEGAPAAGAGRAAPRRGPRRRPRRRRAWRRSPNGSAIGLPSTPTTPGDDRTPLLLSLDAARGGGVLPAIVVRRSWR